MSSDLRINPSRLWQTIERSAEIGVGRADGLARLTLTDDDRTMRDQFREWCTAAGLTVTVDAVGNIFARRAGRENDLPPVVMGSHLDTQFNGGRFDGIVGVLGALEVVRTLNDSGIETRRPIEIAMWTNEEGARYSPPMLGSAVFAGVHPLEFAYSRRADDGALFGDELERIGYKGNAPAGGRKLDCYFELHIEQGPELDKLKIPVGVVTHGYTVYGWAIDIDGETAHTGPWPMELRKNALVGGAMLAVAINDIGWKYADTAGKATAARLVAWPNKPGILSDQAQFTADVRHADPATAKRMADEFVVAIGDAAKRSNCAMRIADQWSWVANIFDDEMVSLVRDTAKQLDIPSFDLPSQAGHDSYHIAKVAPTAMIFTPCKDGITHNNHEYASIEDITPGVNVLLHAALARANRS